MKNLPVYLKGKFSAKEYKYITSINSGLLSQKVKKEYEKIQPEIIKERLNVYYKIKSNKTKSKESNIS